MRKILVAYYSFSKHTQHLAEKIALLTGGDIIEIVPKKKYSFNYNTASKEARNEIVRGFCPELITINNSIKEYDTIFIGTPNWFKTMAPPVLSFLRMHDFSKKNIIPFCTHGGGGFGNIENDIAKECPNVKILSGLAVGYDFTIKQIEEWLEDLDLINDKTK